jgi:hypothetical protein
VENKALLPFDVIDFNWKQMRELPDDHLAMLSVLSYAVSEVNALRRIYLCQEHERVGEKAVDSAVNIQRFLIIRSWSSRLFEAEQFLSKLCSKKSETRDESVQRLAVQAIEEFEKISTGDGHKVAEMIRHESTNHYSFKAAKKNIEHVSVDMDVNMYLTEKSGNSYYPLGEAVMFHARLDRRWANVDSKEMRDELFLEWLTWNTAANNWLENTHGKITNELLFVPLGGVKMRPRRYWAPKSTAGDYRERLTPIQFTGALAQNAENGKS